MQYHTTFGHSHKARQGGAGRDVTQTSAEYTNTGRDDTQTSAKYPTPRMLGEKRRKSISDNRTMATAAEFMLVFIN